MPKEVILIGKKEALWGEKMSIEIILAPVYIKSCCLLHRQMSKNLSSTHNPITSEFCDLATIVNPCESVLSSESANSGTYRVTEKIK